MTTDFDADSVRQRYRDLDADQLMRIALAGTDDYSEDAIQLARQELAQRGLGTLAILRQIEWARREGLDHLYLGYWIDGHGKMDYKRRFQPLEGFDGRQWRRLRRDAGE